MGLNRPIFYAQQNLYYARQYLNSAHINLWRARKYGYHPHQLRHFERLYCAMLDHVWDCQQMYAEIRGGNLPS